MKLSLQFSEINQLHAQLEKDFTVSSHRSIFVCAINQGIIGGLMKKLGLFFVLMIISSVSILANNLPECSNHGIFNATIECTRNEKGKIKDCPLVEWNFLNFPANKDVVTGVSGVKRYICLDSKPGKIGNDGLEDFQSYDVGVISEGRCAILVPLSSDKQSAPLFIGIKDLYKYPESAQTLIFSPGTYVFYANVIDYFGGDIMNGDPSYNGYLKTVCSDTKPITLIVDYEIK